MKTHLVCSIAWLENKLASFKSKDKRRLYCYDLFGIDEPELRKEIEEMKAKWYTVIPSENTVWELEEGDRYSILYNYWEIGHSDWDNYPGDISIRAQGNMFLNDEDAEKARDIRLAKTAILKHHAKNSGFVPDWNDCSKKKHNITYSHQEWKFNYDFAFGHQYLNICYFATEEEADKSIADCEKEWKVVFGVEVNET